MRKSLEQPATEAAAAAVPSDLMQQQEKEYLMEKIALVTARPGQSASDDVCCPLAWLRI